MGEEFEEFFQSQIRKMHTGYSGMKAAWLESARCADRKAREECAETCSRVAIRVGEAGSIEALYAASAANQCEAAIRATIKEE